ncbi:MAG: TraR/DksA family transcriptional regulator [Bryobacterales bacterium]|nr:TraR/DksA family transcriptional regulator [Bryobacterales bacterium]
MTDSERLRFKKALEAKRQEIAREIRAQTAELAIGDAEHDPIDQVQQMNQRDEAVMRLARLSCNLSDVGRSLRAILEGCYGICAICGEQIGFKRLETIPWAVHCLRCQEGLESKETRQRRHEAA